MGSYKDAPTSSGQAGASISGLQQKHQTDLQNLTLVTQPFKTLKLFGLAVIQHLKRLLSCLLRKSGLLLFGVAITLVLGLLVVKIGGPSKECLEELNRYIWFGVWWLALGLASSIGLGSGLHTFLIYLGPHIALFTIKSMQCGTVDLKSAPYDTIRFKNGPSWPEKDCSEFGPPLFTQENGLLFFLGSILPQVRVESVLWGIGTAFGELPPYFISRAARLSGREEEIMREFDLPSCEQTGFVTNILNKIKCQFLARSQYLNFFTVLAFASVPNPLFDLIGIMCGQLGMPFWKFLLATLLGKAIIKTHIQMVFIISICNNHFLSWMENMLIWVLTCAPGLDPVLPDVIANLNAIRDKFLAATLPTPSATKAANWGVSFDTIWKTVIWLILINFFAQIITETAKGYLKKEQEKELDNINKQKQSRQNAPCSIR